MEPQEAKETPAAPDTMRLWNQCSRPPKDQLRKITGGRLNGMTDIKPQWRVKVLTEMFGPCGEGWTYRRTNLDFREGSDGQICVFVDIELVYKTADGNWSEPIPGSGGSMYIAKEKNGLFTSDEAIKMATTDAISVASKMLGVASEIYEGHFDGSKYRDEAPPKPQAPAAPTAPNSIPLNPPKHTQIDQTASKAAWKAAAERLSHTLEGLGLTTQASRLEWVRKNGWEDLEKVSQLNVSDLDALLLTAQAEADAMARAATEPLPF